HLVELLDADTMLAGDRAADLDAALQDLGAKRFGASDGLRVAIVEQDERMKIAIAGVKDIGATQMILAFEHLNGPQHLAESLARDGAIHAIVRGRNTACGRERILATGPETQSLRFAVRDLDTRGACRAQHS